MRARPLPWILLGGLVAGAIAAWVAWPRPPRVERDASAPPDLHATVPAEAGAAELLAPADADSGERAPVSGDSSARPPLGAVSREVRAGSVLRFEDLGTPVEPMTVRIVRVRMLAADGSPAVNARVEALRITPWPSSAYSRDWSAVSGPDGRVDLAMEAVWVPGTRYEVELISRWFGFFERRQIALIDPWPVESQDLGDWALPPIELAARGRVTGRDGGRVYDAEIEVRDPFRPAGLRDTVSLGGNEDVALHWPEPGRFEVWTHRGPHVLELRASATWCPPGEWTPLVGPPAEMALRLEHGGAIRGGVDIDEDFVRQGFRVRASRLDEREVAPVEAAVNFPGANSKTGIWALVGLAPGDWRVQLFADGDRLLLDEIPRVAVGPGEGADVGHFDLRKGLRRVQVDLHLGPAGVWEEEGVILHGSPDLPFEQWGRARLRRASVDLLTIHPLVSLLVWAPGARLAAVDGTGDRIAVALEPALVVELELECATPLTGRRVDVEWLDSDPRWSALGAKLHFPIGEGGIARALLPGQGNYRVALAPADAAESAGESALPGPSGAFSALESDQDGRLRVALRVPGQDEDPFR